MKKKILVVEDEEDMRIVMERILETAGYEVYSDSTGKEVPEIIKSFNPDLILLDLFLQEADGRDICKAIKVDESTSSIPVIIVSGALDIYNTILDLNANDVIEKPFEKEIFLKRIERQLSDPE